MEKTILAHLLFNEQYSRKAITHLREDYFEDRYDQTIFKLIHSYIQKYNSLPSKEALTVELANVEGMTEEAFRETQETIEGLHEEKSDFQWLLDKTEEFCKHRALYNAIRKSIRIIDGQEEVTPNVLPKLFQDALQVSFDTQIGHHYFSDATERFDSYHTTQTLIPFDLEYFNKITNGGIPPGTLNVIMASTGVGKSLAMCHMAANNILCNKKVLYLSLEMAEIGKPSIGQRIDTNLLNTTYDDLMLMPKDTFVKRLNKINETHTGELIIKQYAPVTAGVAHFRHLLNELRLKKTFVPDIIYIDYLNLCVSARIKYGTGVNSYNYIKSVAEEIRGLAIEFKVPIVTATQANRAALISTDIGLENTSDSLGLPMTADFMVALISNDELEDINQIIVKQLKNRYGDPAKYRKFAIGVDKARMKLYDVEQNAQEDIADGPVMDNTDFGQREEEAGKSKFDKSKFKGFR